MTVHRFEVLRRPLITEKYTALQAEGKYAFEVAKQATKTQVKEAVESAFNVKVTGMNLMTVAGKRRRLGRRILAAKPWKKAVVTLKPGDKIELFETAS
jgi:large subunit ribosomal protein L23